MAALIGIDLGQGRKASALCVVESEDRQDTAGRSVDHYTVRFLERLPGASYPDLAERLDTIARAVKVRTGDSPVAYINATGRGGAVVDLLKDRVPQCQFWTVFLTHGDRRTVEGMLVTVGKAWLVGRLQILLQTEQLHMPRSPEAAELASDLRQYEVHVTEDANSRYGAFPVGRHDDLVTALGLAVQEPYHRLWALAARGVTGFAGA